MLMQRKFNLGVTLIELMITVAILSILIFVSIPDFTAWIRNTQIRTAAESILNGMQLARSEALHRNTPVQLQMDAASGWTISVVRNGENIQSRLAQEGSRDSVVTIAPGGATTVTFSNMGRVAANNDGSPAITAIKIDSATLPPADSRELCVTVSAGGVVRLCDPQVAAGDTRACVPAVPAACQ